MSRDAPVPSQPPSGPVDARAQFQVPRVSRLLELRRVHDSPLLSTVYGSLGGVTSVQGKGSSGSGGGGGDPSSGKETGTTETPAARRGWSSGSEL